MLFALGPLAHLCMLNRSRKQTTMRCCQSATHSKVSAETAWRRLTTCSTLPPLNSLLTSAFSIYRPRDRGSLPWLDGPCVLHPSVCATAATTTDASAASPRPPRRQPQQQQTQPLQALSASSSSPHQCVRMHQTHQSQPAARSQLSSRVTTSGQSRCVFLAR